MHDGLRFSGMTLGGLGTGSVELRTDGHLHEWQIMNNKPWGMGPAVAAGADTSFFVLQICGADVNRTAVLGLKGSHNPWLNNPYHLPWVENPERIDSDLRMPFGNLDYHFPDFPVGVKLEAFSPFIPLNAGDTGLPIAFFTFTLCNRTARMLRVSLVHALRNLVGYSEPEQTSVMVFRRVSRGAYIRFDREGLAPECSARGSMASAVFARSGGKATYVLHPRGVRDVHDPLRASGVLENRDYGTFVGAVGDQMPEAKRTSIRRGMPHGVLAWTAALRPRAEIQVTFILAWHFPEMRDRDVPEKERKAVCIGHQYANRFKDAVSVMEYGWRNMARLRRESLAFRDAFYRSTFPRWLLDAVNAQLTTLVKSSWWDRRGRFGIWEGLGCCGLQTTDITFYGSFPIVLFFPELQKSQMRLTAANVEQKGRIPHLMPGNFECCDADRKNRIDLIPQFIGLVWRDLLWTGDRAYAAEMWPHVEDALRFFETLDSDGDGLPNNKGPDQTYDQFPLKGTSAFCGFLYAAALHGSRDMAERLGHRDAAADLRRRFHEAMAALDRQLWNGAYYRLSHDKATGENNDGVMVDQLNGDWFVRQATGAGMVPDERVRSALSAIVKHCSRPDGYLVNCAWPKGGGVHIPRTTSDQANCPWSGTEYAFAAYLALAGMERQALKVARDVWDRYERAGLRFNHIECGGHYYRALSAWAIYLAFTGFSLDRPRGELSLRIRRTAARFVVNTPTSWAEAVTQPKGRILALTVRSGRDSIRSLVLRGF